MNLPKTPSFRLDGRRALVTGAGRGIGLAAAAALAEAGADVTLAARTHIEVEAAADAIRATGGKANALVLDVLDTANLDRLLNAAGPFDILVNNAGGNRPKLIGDTTEDDFDAIVDLNFRAAYFVDKAIVRGMTEAGIRGSIIHISSQMGHAGSPRRTVYCGSKHAIEGLTKALAVELGPQGIRVNSICPTFIVTEMTRPFFDDDAFRDMVLSKIKLGRIGVVEDIMGPVVFLASDASSLVTGASLLVDGGWTAD